MAKEKKEEVQVNPMETMTMQEFCLVIGEQQAEIYRPRRNETVLLQRVKELEEK